MSWPTDGQPRFIVSEVSGGLYDRGRGSSLGHITSTILDRAVAHKNVKSWRSEDYSQGGAGLTRAVAVTRRRAAEHCDALNRDEGESVFEIVNYLGFRLTATERYVTVDAPDGKRLGVKQSMAQARNLAREYRREMRAAA